MVFELSWIGNVTHKKVTYFIFYEKPRLVQSKGQRQQIDGDYKFLTCCSIGIFSFSNLLSRCCYHWRFTGEFMCRLEIGTLAFASWSIPVDLRDLKCSHGLLC